MTEMHSKHRDSRLGVPTVVIVLLGLLGAPRVILHDLDVVSEGELINTLLVFVPLVIWLVVAVWRSANPFVSLVAVGAVYGVCLMAVHNMLWSRTWRGDEPRLGGNLSGRLPDWADELILRGAMSVSSLFTGLAVGTLCGALAWLITQARSRGGRLVLRRRLRSGAGESGGDRSPASEWSVRAGGPAESRPLTTPETDSR